MAILFEKKSESELALQRFAKARAKTGKPISRSEIDAFKNDVADSLENTRLSITLDDEGNERTHRTTGRQAAIDALLDQINQGEAEMQKALRDQKMRTSARTNRKMDEAYSVLIENITSSLLEFSTGDVGSVATGMGPVVRPPEQGSVSSGVEGQNAIKPPTLDQIQKVSEQTPKANLAMPKKLNTNREGKKGSPDKAKTEKQEDTLTGKQQTNLLSREDKRPSPLREDNDLRSLVQKFLDAKEKNNEISDQENIKQMPEEGTEA